MGKSILFLRVSTQKQELESQELVVRRMANADGVTDDNILPPIQYKENATQLGETDREGIQELYSTIENRDDIDSVYVSELSRLSRKPNVLYAIRDFLIARKIQLVCGQPSFRLLDNNKNLDKMASIVFGLFGAFAEQEAIEKKERFARGKEQKALEGKYVGGKVPFGYRVADNKSIVIDEYIDEEGHICGNAHIVRLVYQLYEEGLSQSKIATELSSRGIKINIDLINHILKNESYIGELSQKKKYKAKDKITNKTKEYNKYSRIYPQIISREQFERCRKIANDNNIGLGVGKVKNIYFAENLMRCSSCGSKISASGSKDSYHCYSAYKPMSIWMHEYHVVEKCTNMESISINLLDSLLWNVSIELEAQFMINASDDKVKETEQQIELLNQKIGVVDEKLSKIDIKRKRAVKLYYNDDLSEEDYVEARKSIDKEKHSLEDEKQSYQEKITHFEDIIKTLSSNYIEKREQIKRLKDNGYEDLSDNMIRYWKLQNADIKGIYSSILNVKDDKTRYDIIHRQIESVSFQKVDVYFKYGIGWRKAKANRIIITPINKDYFDDADVDDDKIRFLNIPCGGNKSIYLSEYYDKELNELMYSNDDTDNDLYRSVRYEEDGNTYNYFVVPVQYLNRFTDTKKVERREKEKEDKYKSVEGYLRMEEVMKLANKKYNQIYYAIKKGKLNAVLVQGKYFILPEDADGYIKSLK